MTRFGAGMSVNGPVMCVKWTRRLLSLECEAGAIHRLDHDLELCVCDHCGQGWIRDVDAWTRMNDALDRLKRAIDNLGAVNQKMLDSFSKLNETLKKP